MGFEGRAEEIFEGIVMLLAASILTWMIFWMRENAGKLTNEIEIQTSQVVRRNGGIALFLLAFLAVFREGIELALFLLAIRLASNPVQTAVGTVLGLAAATILGWMLFKSAHRLSLRGFFQVTNILLIIFAAGMVGLGVHELNEAGVVPAVIEHVWDLNPILDEKSEIGLVLKALVGYNGNPSLTSVLGYLLYLSGITAYLLTRKRELMLSYGNEANG